MSLASGHTHYFIHPTAVLDDPEAAIGEGTRIWHFSHIMQGAVIGSGCNLGQNVMIGTGAILGNHVKVQNNVSVYTGVTCEDDVFVGPSVVFTNVINPRSHIERKNQFRNTVVKKGATIGANATIICGVTIGEYAFVGAGAVVTKNIRPFALVTGNPARQTGWVSRYGHKLIFDLNGLAVCVESKQQYLLKENSVVPLT